VRRKATTPAIAAASSGLRVLARTISRPPPTRTIPRKARSRARPTIPTSPRVWNQSEWVSRTASAESRSRDHQYSKVPEPVPASGLVAFSSRAETQ
jgi:hypothetical protein